MGQIMTYDANRLLMMIQTLDVYTSTLKSEAKKVSLRSLENDWIVHTEGLYTCFAYAHQFQVFLGEYKDQLRTIIDNLYSVERIIKERKDERAPITRMVDGIIQIAQKVDNILESFGWKRVVQPITEAIFRIPGHIRGMAGENIQQTLPPVSTKYLPPELPKPSIPPPDPSENTHSHTVGSDKARISSETGHQQNVSSTAYVQLDGGELFRRTYYDTVEVRRSDLRGAAPSSAVEMLGTMVIQFRCLENTVHLTIIETSIHIRLSGRALGHGEIVIISPGRHQLELGGINLQLSVYLLES